MIKLTAEMVKLVRDRAGCNMPRAKEALELAGGDPELAVQIVANTGLAVNVKGMSKEQWVLNKSARELISTQRLVINDLQCQLEDAYEEVAELKRRYSKVVKLYRRAKNAFSKWKREIEGME